MLTLILSAFVLGILGSLHCVGMCGPLVMSMPFQHVKQGKILVASFNYNVGKTFTYAAFGLVAGTIGKGFVFLKWQQSLSIVAGLSLLLITLIPILKSKLQFSFPLQKWFSRLYASSENQTKLSTFFAFGILNGLLPCGLVYTAIAAATVSASALNGILFMTFFGIGTIPSLTSIIMFQHKVRPSFKKYLFKSSYYISICIAVLLILRGLNLGIPYVSPIFNKTTHEVDCCHRRNVK